MNTSFYAFILLIIQQLEWSHAGTAYKFRYLDTYGDDTSMFMEDGFINSDCDGAAYDVIPPSATPLTSKTVPFNKATHVRCGELPSKYGYINTENKNGCVIGCDPVTLSATPCSVGATSPPRSRLHRCPQFVRSRKNGNMQSDLTNWAFEYKAVCTKSAISHTISSGYSSGSLCDFDFTANKPTSLTKKEDCSGKFTITIMNEPTRVIHVSETVFVNRPTLKLQIGEVTARDIVEFNIYEKADTNGKPNPKLSVPIPIKIDAIDISTLAVQQHPYKVVIKTAKAKHWFYLRPFDVKFTLTKTIMNGEAEIKCFVDLTSKYKSALEAAVVDLYSVSSDGTVETLSQTNVIKTKDKGRFKCKLKGKTKKVCFPYEQEMTTIELGYKEVQVESEDLVTTTTTTTTTTTEQSTTTTTEIDSTTTSSRKTTERQTDPETEKTTETKEVRTMTSPVTSTPPDFNFKIYLSDEVTNTSEDLTSASKLLVTERCEDIATEKGCNSCKFNVGRLVTGQDPYIPIDVTGFAGRNKRRLTIEGLKKEFNNNLNENSMVKQRKKSPVKVGEDQGRKKSESKPEDDQTDDDEIIESINNEISIESKNPKT